MFELSLSIDFVTPGSWNSPFDWLEAIAGVGLAVGSIA